MSKEKQINAKQSADTSHTYCEVPRSVLKF